MLVQPWAQHDPKDLFLLEGPNGIDCSRLVSKKNKNLYVLQPHNQLHIVMRVPKGVFKWTGILFYERHPVRSANVPQ
jgi:hypothetical protein